MRRSFNAQQQQQQQQQLLLLRAASSSADGQTLTESQCDNLPLLDGTDSATLPPGVTSSFDPEPFVPQDSPQKTKCVEGCSVKVLLCGVRSDNAETEAELIDMDVCPSAACSLNADTRALGLDGPCGATIVYFTEIVLATEQEVSFAFQLVLGDGAISGLPQQCQDKIPQSGGTGTPTSGLGPLLPLSVVPTPSPFGGKDDVDLCASHPIQLAPNQPPPLPLYERFFGSCPELLQQAQCEVAVMNCVVSDNQAQGFTSLFPGCLQVRSGDVQQTCILKDPEQFCNNAQTGGVGTLLFAQERGANASALVVGNELPGLQAAALWGKDL